MRSKGQKCLLAFALAVTQAAAFVQQASAPTVSLPSLRSGWIRDEAAGTRPKRVQSFSAGPALASFVVVAAVGALRKSLRQRAGASRLPVTMVRATQADVVTGTEQAGEKNYVNPWEQKVEGHPKMGRKFHPYAGPVLNKVPIVEGLTFPLDPTKYTGPLEPPEPGVKWGEGREKDGIWRKRDEDGNVSYEYWQGIGRRKEACAIVQLIAGGTGQFNIVSRGRLKDAYDYFQGNAIFWFKAIEPLTALSMKNDYDCIVKVFGGGHSGQAGAIRLGLAKALEEMDYQLRPVLMRAGFLKRDPRTKEMKKPGQPGARKKKPHHKR